MKNQKPLKKRRRYDEEFKTNALKMIADGLSVLSVSQALGVNENLLYTWKSKSKKKGLGSIKGEQEEIKLLRKRLREVEVERDILKKALRIFSLQNWQNAMGW